MAAPREELQSLLLLLPRLVLESLEKHSRQWLEWTRICLSPPVIDQEQSVVPEGLEVSVLVVAVEQVLLPDRQPVPFLLVLKSLGMHSRRCPE